ncbi:hypothetical protein BpHYR1_016597 [Brachionus plicatilis]|uniref:Uncharacterized protein n=1 Tax=Brachionus plicatilis TaxID=10195 RepID=A0A3M7SKX5_BRAPC|nr:hypothetical protein BpHYR1_016597 [Brachionus plicatilis]
MVDRFIIPCELSRITVFTTTTPTTVFPQIKESSVIKGIKKCMFYMTGEFSFNRDTFFEKNNSNKGKFLPQINSKCMNFLLFEFLEEIIALLIGNKLANVKKYCLTTLVFNYPLFRNVILVKNKSSFSVLLKNRTTFRSLNWHMVLKIN